MSRPAPFGAATPYVQRAGQMLCVIVVGGFAAYAVGIAWELNAGQHAGDALHIDFVAFWAAAKLALAGKAAAAFDPGRLVAAQSLSPDEVWDVYRWHYPPFFHLLITPLGLLPFSASFALFSTLALGAYVWAVARWARPVPGGLALAVASPPALFVLLAGNVSLLWAAAFLTALAFLEGRRPVAAGAMIALLTFKPQLGLAILVALMAGRYWRCFLCAAIGTLAIVALTVVIFGTGYWAAFFSAIGEVAALYEIYGANAVTMVTWYAFARQLGLGHDAALALQAVSLALAALAVALVWARREVRIELRAPVLALATLISTPYAFQYELVLAVIAALFLARAGIGRHVLGGAWLALLWGLPLPGWFISEVEIACYAAPTLTMSLLATVFLALRQPLTRQPRTSR